MKNYDNLWSKSEIERMISQPAPSPGGVSSWKDPKNASSSKKSNDSNN